MTYKASMHPSKVEGSVIQEPQTNCHLVSEARKLFCLFLNLVVDFEGVFFLPGWNANVGELVLLHNLTTSSVLKQTVFRFVYFKESSKVSLTKALRCNGVKWGIRLQSRTRTGPLKSSFMERDDTSRFECHEWSEWWCLLDVGASSRLRKVPKTFHMAEWMGIEHRASHKPSGHWKLLH